MATRKVTEFVRSVKIGQTEPQEPSHCRTGWTGGGALQGNPEAEVET